MGSVQKKLLELKKKYLLTTSDLGVLLSVSRSTARTWENGVLPSPTRAPLVDKELERIFKAANSKPCPFPVPLHVTQYQRKHYLRECLNAVNTGLSEQGTTTGE